jgi:hypothetical protein
MALAGGCQVTRPARRWSYSSFDPRPMIPNSGGEIRMHSGTRISSGVPPDERHRSPRRAAGHAPAGLSPPAVVPAASRSLARGYTTRTLRGFRAGKSKLLQQDDVASNQGFLLGASPSFQLTLAPDGRLARRINFRVRKTDWQARGRKHGGSSILMCSESTFELVSVADVQRAFDATQDVDERQGSQTTMPSSGEQGKAFSARRCVRSRIRMRGEPFDSLRSLRAFDSPRAGRGLP